jgi:hypothetical protein
LLVLPVLLDDGTVLGFLVVVFSRNAGKSSSFNPSLLADILAPAVAVIGEGLSVDLELQDARQNGKSVEKELKLVYEVDEKIHSQSRSHAGLAQLVGQSGRFLGIAYSVLLRSTTCCRGWKASGSPWYSRFPRSRAAKRLPTRGTRPCSAPLRINTATSRVCSRCSVA